MATKRTYWCPNGCGKCVMVYQRHKTYGENCKYKCSRCETIFTKEDVVDYFSKR